MLVVAERWDAAGAPRGRGGRRALLRVNHAQMGLVLAPGLHRVVLRYRARASPRARLCGADGGGAALLWLRERRLASGRACLTLARSAC